MRADPSDEQIQGQYIAPLQTALDLCLHWGEDAAAAALYETANRSIPPLQQGWQRLKLRETPVRWTPSRKPTCTLHKPTWRGPCASCWAGLAIVGAAGAGAVCCHGQRRDERRGQRTNGARMQAHLVSLAHQAQAELVARGVVGGQESRESVRLAR